MRKYLAVVSGQPEYAARFCEAVSRKEKFYFTAVPFETAAALESFAKEHPVSFVLADEEMIESGQLAVLPGNPGIAALSERPQAQQENGGLYRYQSMEEMLRRLSQLCQDVLLASPVTGEGRAVRLTGVYSPANPGLRTAFAVTLAAAGKRDHRTLYMNLEEFSGIRQLMHYTGAGSLTDVLYALKKGQLSTQILNAAIVSTPALDYLPPMQYADDVKETGAEEWAELIRKIAEISGYEELVIDLPPSLTTSSDLMDLCSSVYLPEGTGRMEQARFAELDAYLDMPQHRKTVEKIRRVSLSEDLLDALSPEEDFSEELLYGNFGMMVIKEAAGDRV